MYGVHRAIFVILCGTWAPVSQRVMINRTIDINHSSMANHVLRKLQLIVTLCEMGPRTPKACPHAH